MDTQKTPFDISDLIQLMERLRSPDNGCPWDIEQTFKTIKPHTIEEAYEVADAIERHNMNDLKDELGDLLFQVVFHAQMASESGYFDFSDIIDHVTKKMIFRHPHVFADQKAANAQDVEDNLWEQQKEKEKKQDIKDHYLDDVTLSLPSLLLANKLQKKARKTGFEYPSMDDVFDKFQEELAELKSALATNNKNHIMDEYGDLLFVSALMGSYLKINAEECLRQACLKFKERFDFMEDDLKSCQMCLEDASIDDFIAAWSRAKDNIQKS